VDVLVFFIFGVMIGWGISSAYYKIKEACLILRFERMIRDD
jgi:hypothetical protein